MTASMPHVMNTYGRVPIALERGQGCRVWDVNGKQYLDALGGIAVNTLGHNHPKLVPALQDRGRYKTAYAEGSLRHKLFAEGDRLPQRHAAAAFRDL